MKKNNGFTLIELVIVVALISILAAVALPKYMNFTQDARTALVQATGGSLSASMNLAHAKWQVKGNEEFLDLNGDGIADTQFNAKGWPVGISGDGKTVVSDIQHDGVSGHDACSQIIKNVMSTTNMSVIAANEKGECSSGDFCAKAIKKTECEYLYRPTKELIRYNSQSGDILVE